MMPQARWKPGRWLAGAGILAGAGAAAALLMLAGPATARQAAAPPPASPEAEALPWTPRYDFALEVDGKPSPEACFYQELHSTRIMINAPELARICILNQKGKQVTAVARGQVRIDGDVDQARLSPGAETGAPTSPYTVDASSVVFYVGNNRLKILPKQPLVGPTDAGAILSHSPLYRKGMQAYKPDPSDIAFLKSWSRPVDIEVYFGTWCPHCKVVVPRFMKAIDAAANAKNLRVSYHGVPTGFENYEPARINAVRGIPTFIFRVDGRELGRIPGEPTSGTMEHAVAEILRGVK